MMRKFEIPFRGETKHLTAEDRAAVPGQFIHLADGVTHYELGGKVNGPVVVLVHGFSVPYFIWEPTFQALNAAGFWVLRYDHFGRGYSDRPHLRYDLDLFNRQLTGLLDELGFREKINLIGLSMGGVIAANFAGLHPERVARLGLIDPAGFPIGYSLGFRLLRAPLLGELLFNLAGSENLENSMASDFYDPKHIREFIELYRPQMAYKGFRRALLSTLRAGFLNDGRDVYRRVGESGLPALLVWGENDTTVPFKHHKKLLEWIPQAAFHPIAASGHIPHYEKPEEVGPILLDFLGGE